MYGYFGKLYGTLASGTVITFCSNKMGHLHSGVLLWDVVLLQIFPGIGLVEVTHFSGHTSLHI